MQRPLFALLAIACLALAGCGSPKDPAPTPASSPSTSAAPFMPDVVAGNSSGGWQVIVPGIACGNFCEPVVAVDLAGRVYVKGSTYARSTADGSFEALDPPGVPVEAGPGAFHTDRHLQVAPDGAVWFHSLIGNSAGAFLLLGVQVARSTDGGQSWAAAYLPLEGGVPTQSLGADRQWMAFAPDGTAYVTFQQNAVVNAFTPIGLAAAQPNTANIWVARSDDDGATWTRFSPLDGIDPSSDQATGQPIVDQDGRLLVPFHRSSLPGSFTGVEPTQPSGFAIAVTSDAQTAVQHQVSDDGTMFPALVQLPDGTLLAAHNADGESLDWGIVAGPEGPWELAAFPGATDVLSSPWLGARPAGGWDLVWMQGDGEGRFDLLRSLNGSAPQVVAQGLLGGPGLRANTDFVHAAYLDGRLLIVTSDGDQGKALLLLEPLP